MKTDKATNHRLTPRHFLLALIEDINCAMILALPVPAICVTMTERNNEALLRFYLASWIIFPFIAIVRAFLWKARYYYQYLLLSIACILGCCGCAWVIGSALFGPIFRNLLIGTCGVLLLLVCYDANAIRRNEINRQKAEEANDITWTPRSSLLEYPRLPIIILFAVTYMLALITNCKAMCDVSFCSAFACLFLSLAYQYIRRRENYLKDKRHISNVPVHRIRAISTLFLFTVLIIVLAVSVPSGFAGKLRPYQDIRFWEFSLPAEPEKEIPYIPYSDFGNMEEFFGDIDGPLPERREPPMWLNIVSGIFAAGAAVLVLQALYRALKNSVLAFRGTRENDDIIVSLEDEKDDIQKILKKMYRREPDTERYRIRRNYKKVIRRHRKDRPLPTEMPDDIEKKAGLYGTPEGQELHNRYEDARYSG